MITPPGVNFAEAERQQLAAGLETLDVRLDSADQQRLLHFLELMLKWNRVDNLTAVTVPEQMVMRHILDSLAIVPYIKGPNVLDVGSGAGLPGIPLAIACPALEFVLLDSQRKRVRFMRQAVAELAIDNIHIVQARVEHYKAEQLFATVVSRAFSDISDFILKTRHLVSQHGQWLAMKGRRPEPADAALPADIAAWLAGQEIMTLAIPGLAASRCLIRISKGGD